MKRSVFLIALLFCSLASELNGQISLGIKGGYTNAWPNYGDLDLPDDAETDIDGFNISLLAYKQLSNTFSIGLEPGFVKRGAACVPGWSPIFESDSKLFLHYAELPLMTQWKKGFFKNTLQVHAKLGYGAAYLTSAMEETIDSFGEAQRRKVTSKNDRLNTFDHGIYSGLGLGIQVKQHYLFLETDYYHGFVDSANFENSQNRALNYSLGYMISL